MTDKTEQEQMLESFTKYCKANPEQRFFQALRNWVREEIDADCNFIFIGSHSFATCETEEAIKNLRDTFYM